MTSFIKLDIPAEKSAPLVVKNIIPGKFHRNHTATNDLVNDIKQTIYKRTGVLSVAEVLGVLRVIEHDIIAEQT